MKKYLTALTIVVCSGLFATAMADDDQYEKRGSDRSRSTLDVAPVKFPLYQEECSGCHMAYQPGFLPARSWNKLMTSLDDHFGENAELDEQSQQKITQYLVTNAADHANYKRSLGVMRSLSMNETPLRITKTPYFERKHNELSRRVVQDNPKVQSFSRCEVCHTQADKGSYNEHQVRIPGYGKWED